MSESATENALFVSVMTDLTSRIPIAAEDPRWIQLFSIDILHNLMVSPACLMEYCERWSKTNPATKNFLHFLEQVSSRVRYLHRRGNVDSNSVNEACLGLYIATTTFHYFIGSLSVDEMRLQLLLPLPWPEHIDETKDFRLKRSGVFHAVENLINDCITTIGTINAELRDVKFFCIELLICLLSPCLYKHHQLSSADLPDSMSQETINSSVSVCDIFLHYLTKVAEGDLKYALKNGSFSDNTAAKVVKGLMLNIIGANETPSSSSFGSYLSIFGNANTAFNEGSLLSNLQTKFQMHGAKYDTSQAVSTVEKLSNFLTGIITFGYNKPVSFPANSTTQSNAQIQSFPKYVLAERSSQLLLLLLHQYPLKSMNDLQSVMSNLFPRRELAVNPFQEVFSLLTDESIDRDKESEGELDTMIGLLNIKGPSTTTSLHIQYLHLHFTPLFQYFTNSLSDTSATLLLYTFLTKHPTFIEFLRITANTSSLLLKCLQVVHDLTAPETVFIMLSTVSTQSFSSSGLCFDRKHQLIVATHCIFYMLQDFSLCHHSDPALLDAIAVPAWLVQWTTKVNEMKVIEVIVVVLLRGLKAALYSLQDEHLVQSFLSILKNLLPSVEGLQARIAENLLRMLLHCSKRLVKMHEKEVGFAERELVESSSEASLVFHPLSRNRADSTTFFNPFNSEDSSQSYFRLLSITVRDLILMVSSILRVKLLQNVQLLYGMIMEREQLNLYMYNSRSLLSSILQNSNYMRDLDNQDFMTNNEDIVIVEHIEYIYHVLIFYSSEMERAKEIKMEEYRTSHEAVNQLCSIIKENDWSIHDKGKQSHALEVWDHGNQDSQRTFYSTVPPLAIQHSTLRFGLLEEINWYKQHLTKTSRRREIPFLVSDIWTHILLSSPEFPWRWNKLSVSTIPYE